MNDIECLWKEREKLNPKEGLPLELFEWVSTLTPIPNVDLLILNERNQILLSWRDDQYYGRGWHLPGGCIRFKETIAERIQKTAMNELGCEVIVDSVPISVKEMIMGREFDIPMKRAHHIAMLFRCSLPSGFLINNGDKKEMESGYLRWFDYIPENMLKVHDIYKEEFTSLSLYKVD